MTENREKEDKVAGGHVSPYPVSRLAPPIELVDLAQEIARADDLLSLQVTGKLKLLGKQIQALQEEARKLLEETRYNQELHRAECGFKKIPGRVYHLYKRENATLLFSMLSPHDWGDKPPYTWVGSFRLEIDMSWTAVDEP